MSEDATPAGGMNIVTKAGALLAVLADRGEATPAELASALAEPTSSVYRLISNLEAIDWVERAGVRGPVRLGLTFLKTGRSLEKQFDVRRLTLPHLHELADATGETSLLCIRRGWSAVCVERIEGQEVMSLTFRLGESMPLHRSAVSRAILAYERPDIVQEFLAAARAGDDPQLSDVDPERLEAQLRSTTAGGTSFSDSDVDPGIAAIAAPVFNHRGEVVAAIAVSGMRENILGNRGTIAERTRSAADAVSASLGAATVPAAADQIEEAS